MAAICQNQLASLAGIVVQASPRLSAKSQASRVAVRCEQKASAPTSATKRRTDGSCSVRSDADEQKLGRRLAIISPLALLALSNVPLALAEGKTILVVGATGATGQRIVKQLDTSKYNVVAGARNLGKAQKLGFNPAVKYAKIDVTDDVKVIAKALAESGADVVICATGFVPGNPFKMSEEAKKVDNVGTRNLVDACKSAGIKRLVLVSSILTNGVAAGFGDSPGFKMTNIFGGILDQKLVAEKYLMDSGIDYTILRAGGLRNDAPPGALVVAPEDTLASGEISRDLLASAAVDAVFDKGASNRIVELIQEGTCTEPYCPRPEWTRKARDSWFK
eukprot:jgi/Mesvir1/1409/Mv14410-RA.1